MNTQKHSHVAFSDDSEHKDGQYNSLCLITCSILDLPSLRQELEEIFQKSGIESEFKWSKLRSASAKYKFCAERLEKFIFKNIHKLRVDTLIWDMKDSRHKEPGRDDNENLARMYYHLLYSTLNNRWEKNATWLWTPDHQSSINWQFLGECLVSKKQKVLSNLFDTDVKSFNTLGLKVIKPANSQEEPFIQLADYIAGLGTYSYGHFNKYQTWIDTISGQGILFSNDLNKNEELSETEKIRFLFIESFLQKSKTYKLTLSFKKTSGFKTNDPRDKINFWLYTPQHSLDKAPSKNTKKN